ncbi:MAG: benzoyl-CoA reductase subunit C, partial [Bacteroidia bacterium]|nr:benzoyl-CoA reductase subunit C [Bacteroidia bacterium]
MKNLNDIIQECKQIAFDLKFTRAQKWKEEKEGRVIVGYMPIYFPREIIHAAGGLPIGIFGGG